MNVTASEFYCAHTLCLYTSYLGLQAAGKPKSHGARIFSHLTRRIKDLRQPTFQAGDCCRHINAAALMRILLKCVTSDNVLYLVFNIFGVL